MGERRSDGERAGRRRAHPRGTPAARSGPGSVPEGRAAVDAAGLEALLAAALIRDRVDAGAEQRAVAAFLAAREAAAHGARTRRRDDWRARRRRIGGRSLKATLSVLVAGLALSGVAVAGIGATVSSPDRPVRDTGRTHAPPGATAPAVPDSAAPEAGSGREEADRPASARDTEAHCRAFERAGGRGRALESAAWKRLTAAAGGPAHVEAYCAGQLEELEQDTARPGSSATPGRQGTGRPGAAGNRSSGDPGREAGQGPDGAPGDDRGKGRDGGPGGGTARPAEPGAGNP
ncbi:hypothetical protein [Streptomyces griseoflavus]|uniref:hypothetical protein n=1 Tax=Streptomyces griseoflavus TaxID=35619 RepID=UPI0033F39D6C